MYLHLTRCLPLLLAGVILQAPPAAAATNKIVKTVNGRAILKSEVDDLMRSRMFEIRQRSVTTQAELQAELTKLRDRVTDLLIDQELILKEFEPHEASHNEKIEAMTDEMIRKQFVGEMFKGDFKRFRKTLEEGGISYKKFYDQQKKNMIVESMRAQFARPDTPYVTEAERADWLKRNGQRFRSDPKVKLWSITIPGITQTNTPQEQLALAREIRASLIKGADFAALARTHSTDSVRDLGGSRGWMEKSTFPAPQLWPVVSKIDSGKYSEITPFEGNLYIFWVEARQEGKMPPKAEVDEAVERGVMAEKRQKAAEKWLAELRRKAVIRDP